MTWTIWCLEARHEEQRRLIARRIFVEITQVMNLIDFFRLGIRACKAYAHYVKKQRKYLYIDLAQVDNDPNSTIAYYIVIPPDGLDDSRKHSDISAEMLFISSFEQEWT